MNATWHLAAKDLRLLMRDRAGFFFAFFFPLIYATFFGMIFSRGGSSETTAMPILIVDEDQTDGSQSFISQLRGNKAFRVDAASRENATDRVRRGETTAMVVLPKGFGASRQNPFAGMFTGAPTKLQIGVDPARTAEGAMLEGLLIQESMMSLVDTFSSPRVAFDQFEGNLGTWLSNDNDNSPWRPALSSMREALSSMADAYELDPPASTQSTQAAGRSAGSTASAFKPVEFEKIAIVQKRSGPSNAYAITFPQGIIWAVMGCAAGFGISLVQERTGGTLIRLRMAPIRRMDILAGKALGCLVTILAVCTMMLLVSMAVFGVRPTSFLMLPIAFGAVAICFCGIMMLFAVLGRSERAAAGIGWAINMVMAMIGGGMVPLFFMPQWMQSASIFSPVRWSILAMEGAIWRGFSAAEMFTPIIVLLSIGVGCFAIGVWRFRWSEA